MKEFCEKYEMYLKYVVFEFVEIIFLKNEGVDNEEVILKVFYEGMIDDICVGKL